MKNRTLKKTDKLDRVQIREGKMMCKIRGSNEKVIFASLIKWCLKFSFDLYIMGLKRNLSLASILFLHINQKCDVQF